MKNLFEYEMEQSLEYLEKHNILMGEKIREKVPFGRGVSYGRSKFDFWMLMNGAFFAIECKMQRKKSTISFSGSVIDNNQITTLQKVEQHGGYGLLAVRTELTRPRCFVMSITPLISLLFSKKKKSLRIPEMEQITFIQEIPEKMTKEKGRIWQFDLLQIPKLSLHHSDLEAVEKGRVPDAYADVMTGVRSIMIEGLPSSQVEEFERLLDEMSKTIGRKEK